MPQRPPAAASGDGDRGALQGEFLTRLLSTRAWNTIAAGQAVTRDLDRHIDLPGGAQLTVLSPTPVELDVLRKDWTATVTKAGFAPGDGAAIAGTPPAARPLRPTGRARRPGGAGRAGRAGTGGLEAGQ